MLKHSSRAMNATLLSRHAVKDVAQFEEGKRISIRACENGKCTRTNGGDRT